MTGRTWKFYSITVIVQYIKVLTSLWALALLTQAEGKNRGNEERKTHGANSRLMAFWGLASAVLPRCCPPQISTVDDTRCMSHINMDGRNAGHIKSCYCKPFICEARPLVAMVRQLISFVFHFSGLVCSLFLPLAQLRAPAAYHYQASGPYCITDGVDRRESRQPACFWERLGVCSWVREWKGKESVRKKG